MWDFCFKRSAVLCLAYEQRRVLGLLRASGDVLSAQIGTENMSDPVLDQSSHHSRSVREDKIQTVTSGSLAAAAAAAKAQTRSDIFVISAITLFPSYVLLCYAPLCLFLSVTKSCRLNLESEIREH